jgi:hypothetical protein
LQVNGSATPLQVDGQESQSTGQVLKISWLTKVPSVQRDADSPVHSDGSGKPLQMVDLGVVVVTVTVVVVTVVVVAVSLSVEAGTVVARAGHSVLQVPTHVVFTLGRLHTAKSYKTALQSEPSNIPLQNMAHGCQLRAVEGGTGSAVSPFNAQSRWQSEGSGL